MNVVKYLCEFFFCNFWHFCGLVIVLVEVVGLFTAILPWNSVIIHKKQDEKEGEKEEGGRK